MACVESAGKGGFGQVENEDRGAIFLSEKRVMVAMSGGVDSSVAAAILQEQGLQTSGATLKLTNQTSCAVGSRSRTCCILEDIEDARSVALNLGIEYFVLNHTQDFRAQVIDRFIRAYQEAETPNPCIDCNRYIKFESFFDQADILGFDYLATGHYAQVSYDETSGRYLLKKGKDHHKDQSYVLYSLTQKQLAKTLFPLGQYEKSEIREIALKHGFINAAKPDSQDICFVPDGNYRAFLESEGVVTKPGNFIDLEGKILGQHKGIEGYTIGQRKGLGISSDRPLFVVAKSAENNTVTLGREEDLYSPGLLASGLNWISIPELTAPMEVTVKVRYSQQDVPAVIMPVTTASSSSVSVSVPVPAKAAEVKVLFSTPQRAISPGQAAVFYQGDVVVGGGTIVEALR